MQTRRAYKKQELASTNFDPQFQIMTQPAPVLFQEGSRQLETKESDMNSVKRVNQKRETQLNQQSNGQHLLSLSLSPSQPSPNQKQIVQQVVQKRVSKKVAKSALNKPRPVVTHTTTRDESQLKPQDQEFNQDQDLQCDGQMMQNQFVNQLKNDQSHFQPLKTDWSQLPPGFIVSERYIVVDSLIKGSGGSVYLVKDLVQLNLQRRTSQSAQFNVQKQNGEVNHQVKLDSQQEYGAISQDFSHDSRESTHYSQQDSLNIGEHVNQLQTNFLEESACLRVMKVYSNATEFELFQKEFETLSLINKVQAQNASYNSNLIRTFDAQLVHSVKNEEAKSEKEIMEERESFSFKTQRGVQTRAQKRKEKINDNKQQHVDKINQNQQLQEFQQVEAAYIVFEYCDKGDLFQYVKSRQTLVQAQLCHAIFYQILCAVNFLHQVCKISHLDIKLENLVVDASYRVKLIDFAFCEKLDQPIIKTKGTVQYLSPEAIQVIELNKLLKQYPFDMTSETDSQNEQHMHHDQNSKEKIQQNELQNQNKYQLGVNQPSYLGEKADMYSLGILLFLMYFGFPPLSTNSPNDPYFHLLCSGDEYLVDQYFSVHPQTRILNQSTRCIPQSLKQLFAKLLHFDPSKRPSVQDLLNQDLWLNDINNMSTVEDYLNHMHKIHLINQFDEEALLLLEQTHQQAQFNNQINENIQFQENNEKLLT
eukprot:403359500